MNKLEDVYLRFDAGWTDQEIAEDLCVTRERIRQIRLRRTDLDGPMKPGIYDVIEAEDPAATFGA